MRHTKRLYPLSSSQNDKIFVIGDIHGCSTELQSLLEKLPLSLNSKIVFVGDYVDRGENSKEVIEIILNLKNYYDVVTLMGNHEAMFLDFIQDPGSTDAGAFIYNGGSATLASYATQKGNYLIPDEHVAFLRNLKLFSQTEKYFFVHAGVPDVPLDRVIPALHKNDLLWVRESFHNSKFNWNKLIIHGHTPVQKVEVTSKRVNVDTGCVFDNCLSAYEAISGEVYSVKKSKKSRHIFLRDESSPRVAIRFEGKVPVNIIQSGIPMPFQTRNYSEFGMLVECLNSPSKQVLNSGEKTAGEIKLMSDEPLRWEGNVVRIEKVDNIFLYAIQFLRSNRD